jgi:hypothetical protein
MIKTGFIGYPDKSELDIITRNQKFKVSGCWPRKNEIIFQDDPDVKIPVISEKALLNDCDIIIIGHSFTDITDLLKEVIKRSVPIMFLNPAVLNSGLISDLIKLQEESQTVVYVNKAGKSKSLLKECRQLITHPSLFELRYFQVKPGNVSANEYNSDVLFRILDALLFLCPLNYQKIQAFRQPQNISGTCLMSARIEFDNGSVANIISTDLSDGEYFTIDIHQQCRLLKVDLLKNQVQIFNKTARGIEINSKAAEFSSTYAEEFRNELNNFHKAVIQKDFSGNELFNVSRITNLSARIITKTGFS